VRRNTRVLKLSRGQKQVHRTGPPSVCPRLHGCHRPLPGLKLVAECRRNSPARIRRLFRLKKPVQKNRQLKPPRRRRKTPSASALRTRKGLTSLPLKARTRTFTPSQSPTQLSPSRSSRIAQS